MRIWHTDADQSDDLQILQLGYEPVGKKAKWGPGRRNFYILQYVLEGKGYFNGAPVEKGQGFLMQPMMTVEYHPDPEEPWNYFWICFDGEGAKRLCDTYIHADANGIFTYDFRGAIVQKLKELSAHEPNLGNLYGLSVFYSVLSNHETHSSNKNPYVDQAVSYMQINFHRSITVEEIAGTCGIDDRYLYNLFIKHLGISPKQYLNELRLDNAKKLLRGSDCTVTEVAFSVGFTDVLAFSRFFSKHIGKSPTAYRQNTQGFDFV